MSHSFDEKSRSLTFPDWMYQKNLYAYIICFVPIDEFIKHLCQFFPKLIEVDNNIYRTSHTLTPENPILANTFGDDLQSIQKYNNMYEIEQNLWLMGAEGGNPVIALAVIKTAAFFMDLTLHDTYPDRKFAVEIHDGLYDEDGYCLTFYEIKD